MQNFTFLLDFRMLVQQLTEECISETEKVKKEKGFSLLNNKAKVIAGLFLKKQKPRSFRLRGF